MSRDILSAQWFCTGRSVRGAAHDRSGLPNQDAIDWYPQSESGLPLILAVADGHGSAKSFRSDRGSQFAVKTAIEVIRNFLVATDLKKIGDLAKSRLIEQLTDRVVELTQRWQEHVDLDLAAFPFTELEKAKLLQKEGEKGLQSIQDNPLLVYGATLLIVAITESSIIYLQLGDGDILRVDADGKTTKPVARDPNLIGNETTSLCMDNAWTEFKIEVEFLDRDIASQTPVLILLSTDGYSNSYSSDEEFFKIGNNYLQEIRVGGIKSIDRQLQNFLGQISSGGSGDDITLGIASRFERPASTTLPSENSKTTTQFGASVVTVENPKRSRKSNSNVNLLERLAILISLLMIGSTCLNTYFFFKLSSAVEKLSKIQTDQHQEQPTKSTGQERKQASSTTKSVDPSTNPQIIQGPIQQRVLDSK
jgi:serine/threonine protein phosphatase PrpC